MKPGVFCSPKPAMCEGCRTRGKCERFELPAGEVREALAAELATERGRELVLRHRFDPPVLTWA